MADRYLDAARRDYEAKAAGLMGEAARIVARPNPDAGDFADLQAVAERGRALDPVASARADMRLLTMLSPLLVALSVAVSGAFISFPFPRRDAGYWCALSFTCLVVAGTVLFVRTALRHRRGLASTGLLRGTWSLR